MCEKKQHYSTKPPRWEVPVRFLVKTWASALPGRNPASGLRNKPAGVKTKSRTENHFQWQAPYDIITAENGPRPIRPACGGACAAGAARCACWNWLAAFTSSSCESFCPMRLILQNSAYRKVNRTTMKKISICFCLIILISLIGCSPQQTPPILSNDTEITDQGSSSSINNSSEPAYGKEHQITTLSEKLNVDLSQIESFKYERLSAQEEQELLLTGKDALIAAESMMAFSVSIQDSKDKDPVVGGAKRYTLTFLNGDILVVYDNGMLSINDEKDIYKREGEESITIPENAQWSIYTVDLLTGERSPAGAAA